MSSLANINIVDGWSELYHIVNAVRPTNVPVVGEASEHVHISFAIPGVNIGSKLTLRLDKWTSASKIRALHSRVHYTSDIHIGDRKKRGR